MIKSLCTKTLIAAIQYNSMKTHYVLIQNELILNQKHNHNVLLKLLN